MRTIKLTPEHECKDCIHLSRKDGENFCPINNYQTFSKNLTFRPSDDYDEGCVDWNKFEARPEA